MKRTPLYAHIRDFVLEQIRLGRWRANEQLPTEAELAEQFRVSRFTVKKALGELAAEGLIFRIQGKGSFVSPEAGAAAGLAPSYPAEAGLPSSYSAAAGLPSAYTGSRVLFLTPSVNSPLFANIAAGAEEVLSASGVDLVIRSSRNELDAEQLALREAVHAGVRGVLLFPVDGEAYNEEALRLTLDRFPVVVIDRYLRGVDTNCVCSDHAGGAFDAISHLIDLGHRNIAYVSIHGKPTTSLQDRRAGYEKALAAHRLPIGESFVRFENDRDAEVPGRSPDRAIAQLRDFLSRHRGQTTAVFAATSLSGIAVMRAAAELGIAVPSMLSVVFFDDVEGAELHRTAPTCVVQQERALGVEAAKLLLSVIDDPQQERRSIVLPTRLIARESTAPPRGDD